MQWHKPVVHHIEETHSFFAHHVALFNLHVVEIDFAGAEHMPADFMQRVNLNAGLTGVDPPQGFSRNGKTNRQTGRTKHRLIDKTCVILSCFPLHHGGNHGRMRTLFSQQQWIDMKVLVTGATSGLGRNAVEFLCQKGTGREEAVCCSCCSFLNQPDTRTGRERYH